MTTHLHTVPRPIKIGGLPPIPSATSWHAEGQLYLYRNFREQKIYFYMSLVLYNLFEVKIFVKIITSFHIQATLQYHTRKRLIKRSF